MIWTMGWWSRAALLSLLVCGTACAQSDRLFRSDWEDCDGTLQAQVYGTPGSWVEATGFSWPQPYGNAFALSVPTGRSISLLFTAGVGSTGLIELAERASLAGGAVSVSISTCQADFRVARLNTASQRCLAYNGTPQPTLVWTNGLSGPTSCPLLAGRRYFLNIAYQAIPYRAGDASTCGEESCGTWVLSRSF